MYPICVFEVQQSVVIEQADAESISLLTSLYKKQYLKKKLSQVNYNLPCRKTVTLNFLPEKVT